MELVNNRMIITLVVIIMFYRVVQGDYSYAKTSLNMIERLSIDEDSVPTLEDLFQRKTYWDINNITSPCKFTDERRNFLCQKVTVFDKEGYEESLETTRKLFLGRLDMNEEPHVTMSTNQLKFLSQLEEDIENGDAEKNKNAKSIFKSKYDMHSSKNVISNSMHESLEVDNCENIIEKSNSLLCLNFDIPLKNLIGKSKYDNQQHYHKLDSVILWFYVKHRSADNNVKMEILNLQYSKKAIVFNQLGDGWNTLDVKDIFHLPHIDRESQNKTLRITLLIKCLFECKIQASSDDEEAMLSNESKNEIIVSKISSKKPVLSVKFLDELDDNKSRDNQHRTKRDIRSRRVTDYSQTDYSANLCKNNYPNSMKECCLVTYFVDFNALKWSWILSPSGFLANYCSGRCNEKKSFKVASMYSQNAEVKLTYNEKFLTGNNEIKGEMMETCCHPVSTDSLVIKYIVNNGSIISKVLPNMIITGCGCS